MKKLIIYYAGEWALRLLTLERYKEVEYFIDDDPVVTDTFSFLGETSAKSVYPSEILTKENPDDVIIIISDNYKYEKAKDILTGMGFIESVHFFNGWKLEYTFYKRYYGESSWVEYEKNVPNTITENGFETRAKMMADMIPGDVASIMDLGCGACYLKKYISNDIRYYGLDICERDNVDFVCDLNRDPLPDVCVDMYFMAGLLYYIDDAEKFISGLVNAKYILWDYGGTERYLRLDGVPADPLVNARNSFHETEQLFDLFRKNGFVYEKGKWDWHHGKIGWHIYLFRKL